ncbi:hypothetical protein V9K67_12240 [Paraflavisolibacter sp. H34]|uniref:hypothetical protein n=1 Tax=Huijunlia imazamoxiresistens TaxID=3127457 RepID=UPI003019C97A
MILVALWSCGGNDNNTANEAPATENPSAIDTTQHPTGITSGSVISTDTAAMTPPDNTRTATDTGKKKD